MAWLTTTSGKRYYYRKVWTGGTCHSEYVGGGRIGQLAERIDAQERQQRRAEREAERRRLAEIDDLDRQIDQLGADLADMIKAALLVAGYRSHKRQWRLQRGSNDG